MAVDAFIYFISHETDTQVWGETTDDYFSKKGGFEIKDFSFGVEHPSTLGSATGGGASGKTKFNEFTIKKTVDEASCLFFKNCCAGVHYKHAVVCIRKAGAEAKKTGDPFLCYEFGMVFTTKIEWSGPGEEGPEESITFFYGKFGLKYIQQNEKGKMMMVPMVFGWDQLKNKVVGADELKFDKHDVSKPS